MSMRYRIFAAAAFVVIVTMLVVVFVSCGKGQLRSSGAGWSESTALPGASSGAAPVSRTLAQVIAEIEAYEPPADEGVDPDVFEMLREEFIRQIEAHTAQTRERRFLGASGNPTGFSPFAPLKGRSLEIDIASFDRLTSSAPMGDAGRVTDLAYDPDSDLLTWSYANRGDYDLSGEVGVPDITPIAQNYLAITDDGVGNDAYEAWVDGDSSGEVGISDITPIAENYLNDVMEYRIVTSDSQDDGFTAIGDAVPFGEQGEFPKTYSVALPDGADAYVAVEPVGADLAPGEMSNIVEYIHEPTWHIETVDSEGSVGYCTSIALDSSGYPHVSYFAETGDDLKYAHMDASGWHTETVDNEGKVGWYSSIALDSSNHPHISYYDGNPNDDLKYAYYDGAPWQIETVDSEGDVGTDTSIALDSSGLPHISYTDESDWVLKYTRFDGADWQTEIVGTIGVVGWSSSIAIDSFDNPHISFYDADDEDLKYAFHNGTSWLTETVDSEEDVGGDTSIALDSADNPHISYKDYTNEHLKYSYFDGTIWHIETVDIVGTYGGYTSIALDSSGYPHVSYCKYEYQNDDLKYAYMDASGWHIETLDSEGSVGQWTSIALDSSDNPHISYYDATNGDLKYAYWE